MMTESDQTLDVEARTGLIHEIAAFLAEDAVMLPLYQFPNIASWNTTKLGGPVDQDAGSYQAWQNIHQWEDVDGDGQIIVGAEQWPECLNPVTECANSSWYQWTAGFKVLPSLWDTTSEGEYVPPMRCSPVSPRSWSATDRRLSNDIMSGASPRGWPRSLV